MLERMFGGTTLEGRAKWYYVGQIVLMITIFWTMSRFMFILIIFNLGVQWWDLVIYFILSMLLFYLFFYGPMKKEKEAQQRVAAIDWGDALIQKGKKKPLDAMLPFKYIWELDLKLDDEESLKKKLKSIAYLSYEHSFIQSQVLPSLKRDPEKAEELKNLINAMVPIKKVEEKGVPIEEQDIPLVKIDEKKISNDLLLLQQKIQESNADKTKFIPFEKFDLEKRSLNGELSKELLKTLKVYYVYFDHEVTIDGEVWKEIIIILPGEYGNYHTLLKTSKEEGGEINGWEVNLRTCFEFWLYLWLLGKEIPVLTLTFSENMVQPALDHITKLNAEARTFLELRVLEIWNADLQNRPEKLEKEVQFLEGTTSSLEHTLSDRIQQQAHQDVVYSTFLKEETQERLKDKLQKYKKRYQFIGIILIMVVLLFCFLFAFLM